MDPHTAERPRPGLPIPAVFSTPGADSYAAIEWGRRDSQITGKDGEVVWAQRDVEAPAAWSDLAVRVVASKYFYGDPEKTLPDGRPEREQSVRQLVARVADPIAKWAAAHGYFAEGAATTFRDELTALCLGQYFAFNSPVWFNMGLWHKYGIRGAANNYIWDPVQRAAVPCPDVYQYPQGSACFIQSVTDDMEGIMALATSEAMLFKCGSGTGSDLSTLRSSREKVSGGGQASGPVSFMRIYDAVASVIKSGGKCLAPHQPVFTAGGVKPVKELADAGKDFTVLSFDKIAGRIKAKTARAWAAGRKDVWALITDKGEFHLSADHPVMLKTGEFIRVADLQPGMSLMASKTHGHNQGYTYVNLQNERDPARRRELLHRLAAEDVCGWDVADRIVHHHSEDINDSEPGNLVLMDGQSAHAKLHNDAAVAEGRHVFQTRTFDHSGAANGMHASGGFWQDKTKVAAFKAKQGVILTESNRAVTMQAAAAKVRMLNTGYRLINAGHDIPTFDDYFKARTAAMSRGGVSKAKLLAKFIDQFGSYAEFYRQLREGNHRVVATRRIGPMDVYDVEVDCPTPDDDQPWSGHNFAIAAVGSTSMHGTHLHVSNTRRAAKLQSLKCWHPDILEFIEAKAGEEKKAHALIAAGYEANFNGEAYSSVLFQNCNMSVRATHEFLTKCVHGEPAPGPADLDWQTRAVTDGRTRGMPAYNASRLLDKVAEGTWACGDPGLQYEDTIQEWHTCPNTAPINSSNPCSEYMHIDNSACNLASVNLLRLRNPDGTIDDARLRAACRVAIVAQDAIVDMASYPTPKIAEIAHKFRQLGLGFTNLGSLLMACGRAYDSAGGRALAGALMALIQGQAYLTSAALAQQLGPFEGFAENREPMLRVIRQHRDAVDAIDPRGDPEIARLKELAVRLWIDVVAKGEEHGFRNSQVSVIAPCGTISFMMDADTTGIEPPIGLVTYKDLAGRGQLKLVNQTVPLALETLGYPPHEIREIVAYVDAHDTIEGAPHLEPDHLPVFDCAFPPANGTRSISWHGHVEMMAAVQPFVSGAISKTVNMPADATPRDIREAYLEGWRLGLKALAIYRNGSKGHQPVSTSREDPKSVPAAADASAAVPGPSRPVRRRLPDTRRSLTHKFSIQGTEGYFTTGFFEDGTPGELFITMAKEGSTVGGLMDTIGTLVSMGLQYGVPLEVLVNKFAHTRFEPSGFTPHRDIPMAKSIVDYIFRWLGMELIPGYREEHAPKREPEAPRGVTSNLPMWPDRDAYLTPEVEAKVLADLRAGEWAVTRHGINGHTESLTLVGTPRDGPNPYEAAWRAATAPARTVATAQLTGPACQVCGAITVPVGPCYRCLSCGEPVGGCG